MEIQMSIYGPWQPDRHLPNSPYKTIASWDGGETPSWSKDIDFGKDIVKEFGCGLCKRPVKEACFCCCLSGNGTVEHVVCRRCLASDTATRLSLIRYELPPDVLARVARTSTIIADSIEQSLGSMVNYKLQESIGRLFQVETAPHTFHQTLSIATGVGDYVSALAQLKFNRVFPFQSHRDMVADIVRKLEIRYFLQIYTSVHDGYGLKVFEGVDPDLFSTIHERSVDLLIDSDYNTCPQCNGNPARFQRNSDIDKRLAGCTVSCRKLAKDARGKRRRCCWVGRLADFNDHRCTVTKTDTTLSAKRRAGPQRSGGRDGDGTMLGNKPNRSRSRSPNGP